MKIALIPPVESLHYAEQGDMLMALTHLVLKNKKYAEFYEKSIKYKLLDNSAYECDLQGIKNVLKAAEMIKASEIILPDIIFDCDKTLTLVEESIEYLSENKLLDKYKLMAVPQGHTEEEWWQCFEELESNPLISVIGLSKLSCPKCFNQTIANSRLTITSQIQPSEGKEYHLLGGSFEILREVEAHPSWVRSIDSSAPFEFGKRRILLNSAKEDPKGKAKLHVPVRSWNKSFVQTNIKLLMER